jgi:hypothetical protein
VGQLLGMYVPIDPYLKHRIKELQSNTDGDKK